jgi:3-oxoacyl-[acyl-carrier protein] reductase
MVSERTTHTALVTGAGSGLGRATAAALQAAGWQVAGVDLSSSDTDLPLNVDVTDAAAVRSAVAETIDAFGRLDGVAHCAGVFRNTLTPVHDLDDDTWNTTIGVNLTGSFIIARAVLPALVASRGSLVLVASTSARHPQPGGVAYAASKAGVRALVEGIALEYAPLGVRACSVSPGYMETGMTAKVLSRDDLRAAIEATIPIGHIADPAEVAEVVTFLLGDGARFLTGQDVMVDGGRALTAYSTTTDVEHMWARHDARAGDRARR